MLRREVSTPTPRLAAFECISRKGQTAMTLENSEPFLRQCSGCQLWFEKSTFPPRRARCRKCHLARLAYSVWKSKLRHEYGITPEIHQAIYKDQGGKCYFCDVERSSRGKRGLAVDHDKETGFVRGLLCRPCNANWLPRVVAGRLYGPGSASGWGGVSLLRLSHLSRMISMRRNS